jgi:hypothetical protein
MIEVEQPNHVAVLADALAAEAVEEMAGVLLITAAAVLASMNDRAETARRADLAETA